MTPDIQAEAQFLAKANGVVAGIALANMVFTEVDPSLKVKLLCFFLH
jgi:nicotinate-nucleotide pyrophosphorylase (carboxylating)